LRNLICGRVEPEVTTFDNVHSGMRHFAAQRLSGFGGGGLGRSDLIGQLASTGGPPGSLAIAAPAVPQAGQWRLVSPELVAQHCKS